MTREEQINMADELHEIDVAMETASKLLWIVMDEHFISSILQWLAIPFIVY